MKRSNLIKIGERINKIQEDDNIRNNTRKNKINTKRKNRLSHNLRKYITHRAIIRREPSVSIHYNKVKSNSGIINQVETNRNKGAIYFGMRFIWLRTIIKIQKI